MHAIEDLVRLEAVLLGLPDYAVIFFGAESGFCDYEVGDCGVSVVHG